MPTTGDSATPARAGFSELAGVNALIKAVPTPDVLIANAGVTLPGEVGSIERETRDRLYYLPVEE